MPSIGVGGGWVSLGIQTSECWGGVDLFWAHNGNWCETTARLSEAMMAGCGGVRNRFLTFLILLILHLYFRCELL